MATNEELPTFELGATARSAPPRRAFVAVLEGAAATSVALGRDAPVTVGRSRTCTVHVDDGSVSRLQATISWDGARTTWVEDHGSKNGTFVGGTRVSGRTLIPEGAIVHVGPVQLVVVLPRDPAARSSASGAPFVAADPAMQAVVALLARAAQKHATVLLLGETGSGKEVMARFVHTSSPRKSAPFIALNCGSVPESLAESTLFGHERGAFTGALQRQLGVFEQANTGTLFLDEIGELSQASQTRLLRVLEEHRVTRLGAQSSTPVDVRVIAATHRDLHEDVKAGRFREDLLYRIDVVRVCIPALRERPDDVLPLAEFFLHSLAPDGAMHFADDAIEALRACAWPGNARQLRNAIQRGVALATGAEITRECLGLQAASETNGPTRLQSALEQSEHEAIVAALEACGGNQTHAARQLGIARRTLIYKLEKYGIKPAPGGRSR